MKNINIKSYIAVLFLGLLFSCDDGLESINENPNQPEIVPTSSIFSFATRDAARISRGSFSSGRLALPWMQYWGQTAYADEDRFAYREGTAQGIYQDTYLNATDFKAILDLNTNEDTKDAAAASGNNDNQIAASRVMLSYIFFELTNYFGDVPYYSYGTDDEEFQALSIDETFSPVFASQEKIYADILSELRAAADQFNVSAPVFNSGDNIFNGDAAKWKKFANSLILRVANNLRGVDDAAANAAISAAIASGVMTSNADNAAQKFDTQDLLASPFWRAFITRSDFAVTAPFVQLLKGERANFGPDPRLFEMAAPISADIEDIKSDSYERSENYDDYIGIPYAFPNANVLGFNTYSFMSSKVLRPDYSEMFMEYSEVAFLLSEINGFSQEDYENGVSASMDKWGVDPAAITSFVASLPPANEANVLNQKYIALYMQPSTAYLNYRKTGFPNTLIKVGEVFNLPPNQVEAQAPDNRIESFPFDAIPPITDLPDRLTYPIVLQTLNGTNRTAAASKLSNGDALDSKLFWDNN